LGKTLLAWLDHQGKVPEIAAALHVHPQTVRYRLGRLRECFGSALDDPEDRFELALALRARSRDWSSSMTP
jgi:DNA-binding PucR family transcriptional regulator